MDNCNEQHKSLPRDIRQEVANAIFRAPAPPRKPRITCWASTTIPKPNEGNHAANAIASRDLSQRAV